MSIEVQFRADTFAALMTATLVRHLDTTCLPVFNGFSIDHIEVVANGVSVVQQAVGPAVLVGLDVFIVTDVDLLAAPNSTPAGASVPAARITVTFAIGVALEPVSAGGRTTNHSFLTLTPGPITLPPLPPVPGLDPADIERRLREALPSPRLELTQALALLGLTSPQQAAAVLVDDTVAARFDPTGPPQRRLFGGQDWGLFADAQAVERIVVDRLSPPVMQAMPEARVNAHYQEEGGVPRVIVEIDLSIEGDFVGHPKIRFAIDLGAGLSVVTFPLPLLRVSADWSFHIFADAVPGFLEALAEKLVQDVAADLIDPKLFGATRTGDRSFVIDMSLPELSLPGVRLRYDTLPGSADGMTLGGAVLISRFARSPFKITVSPLASPLRIQLCSQLARTGSGARSPEPPSIYNTKCYGQVQIDGSGVLCAVEQRSPATPLAFYLTAPPVGSTTEPVTLRYGMPYVVALGLAQPLTLVVRTAHGVRFIDLGRAPAVRTDAAGVLLDRSRDYYIKDCLNVVPREKGAYGLGWGLTTAEVKTRPIEEPEWAVYLQQAAGLVVQVVRLERLQPHELVRFSSLSHAIDVTADESGRVAVPVMLPLAASVGMAQLTRASGQSLEGHFQVESAVFERHLTLPGLVAAPAVASGSGGLRVATRTRRQMLVANVSGLGATVRAASGSEAALNPQPLPPVEAPTPSSGLAERAGLTGVQRVVLVPGFDDLAVALLADGSKLLLAVPTHGPVRIAGTFAGPIGDMALVGPWAVSQTAQTLAVFQVTRDKPARCC